MAGRVFDEPPPVFNSFRAWTAVFGASLALFCTVGYLNAFGVYQEYYTTFLPGTSASTISWIGSISIFLLYLGSPFAGLLVDKVGPTILLGIGSFGVVFSLFMASLCTKYYQLVLSQAVLLGASMSLILTPCVAVVLRRMPHRRGLALGITIGGSSIGGIIWPIMLDKLLYDDRVSFAWVMRIVAFTMLPLFAIACATVIDTPKIAAKKTRERSSFESKDADSNQNDTSEKPATKKVDFSMLRNRAFLLLCLGLGITYLGLFTPFFYVSSSAIEQGISSSTAFYLISAINAASFFGRVIPGYLADKYGHFNLCAASIAAAGIIGFTWSTAHSLAGLIVWSIAYGFSSGAVVSLQAACAGKVAKPESQGTATGLLQGAVSIAALVGTPISGQILESAGYLGLGLWTGTTLLTGSIILTAARFNLSREVFAAH
ncbi:major facilitator superfamily transporter [Xylariomycetidae sp. FL0641]|nr:major facilitator superfamily transporter [Xylariomycetidae sp. FL0641]